ncbi:MAG: hypothetical protein AAF743_17430, partial [Planctomycetota bacterium]
MAYLLLFLLAFAPSTSRSTPTAQAPVLVLTVSPGEISWERFGHNALVVDGIAYDWGRFEFGTTTGEKIAFGGRFVQGDMQ